jgi:hypothetical protein
MSNVVAKGVGDVRLVQVSAVTTSTCTEVYELEVPAHWNEEKIGEELPYIMEELERDDTAKAWYGARVVETLWDDLDGTEYLWDDVSDQLDSIVEPDGVLMFPKPKSRVVKV